MFAASLSIREQRRAVTRRRRSSKMKRFDAFRRSTIGQKAVAAVTGALLFVWVLLHLLGNLTIFSGAGATDGYAAALHRTGPLLWLGRGGLFLALFLHVALTWSFPRPAPRAR